MDTASVTRRDSLACAGRGAVARRSRTVRALAVDLSAVSPLAAGRCLGLGLGASSYIEETRFSNRRDLDGYLEICGSEDGPAVERLREEICRLTRTEREEEFFFLGLRRMAGVRRSDYRARFGEDWGKYRDPMTRLIRQGFLKETPEGIALTEAGIDVSNAVFAELLA